MPPTMASAPLSPFPEASGEILDGAELKALSMPAGLRLLLCAELDIFLCVTAKSATVSLRFPPLSPLARKLVALCATRFRLTVTDSADGVGPVVSGAAVVPLLRYVDFLPGCFHLDEVLTCLGISAPTEPRAATTPGARFEACCGVSAGAYAIKDDEPQLLHGLGHYLQIDMGLPLATHGHLVSFTVKARDLNEAMRAFQRFSGWSKFDLRWIDERSARHGVLVMPSVADCSELLGRYEDCESDSDETFAFSLRPVAPLVSVPYMDDSQVKKLRLTQWPSIVEFWSRFPRTRGCVVVSNFAERATLADLVKLFDGAAAVAPLVDATLIGHATPAKARRVHMQFSDPEGARAALDIDGRNFHGASLRVAVAPPYLTATRVGTAITSLSNPRPETPVTPVAGPANPAAGAAGSGPNNNGAGATPQRPARGSKKSPVPANTNNSNNTNNPNGKNGKGQSANTSFTDGAQAASASTTTPPANAQPQPGSTGSKERGRKDSKASKEKSKEKEKGAQKEQTPKDKAAVSTGNATATTPASKPAQPIKTPSPIGSTVPPLPAPTPAASVTRSPVIPPTPAGMSDPGPMPTTTTTTTSTTKATPTTPGQGPRPQPPTPTGIAPIGGSGPALPVARHQSASPPLTGANATPRLPSATASPSMGPLPAGMAPVAAGGRTPLGQGMNVEAKEFVPRFSLSPALGPAVPPPPPPHAGGFGRSPPIDGSLPPPPPYIAMALPPAYADVVVGAGVTPIVDGRARGMSGRAESPASGPNKPSAMGGPATPPYPAGLQPGFQRPPAYPGARASPSSGFAPPPPPPAYPEPMYLPSPSA